MRRCLIVLFILFPAALAEESTAGRYEKVVSRYEKVVNRMVRAINEGDYGNIGNDFDQTMEDFFPIKKRKPFFENLAAQYGKIKRLEKPQLPQTGRAISVAHCEWGELDITIWLNDQNRITGLLFLPHKADLPVHERNKTKLSLPFMGKWLVSWGGDTKELNQHHDARNQRFAFDFLGVDKMGKTRKGNAQINEDYFAFGRKILTPAQGTVTDVIRGVRDNVPGSMNPYSALGNAVFVQHSEHEVSVLAHLKYGSITVRVGDKVRKGQMIGLCGNSGNSSEPHLHYHLQNTPIIQDGTGIKCYFQNITVLENDKKKSKTIYSPIKSEIIIAE
jgi:hypothetical protein